MEERIYIAKVVESSKELDKKEKISLKDTGLCTRLDESTKNGTIKLHPDFWVKLSIHNEKAKDRPDYEQYVIVDKDGERYLTGSKSFYNSFKDIADEMEGEDFEIEVYRLPSKNYSGKDFITCRLA